MIAIIQRSAKMFVRSRGELRRGGGFERIAILFSCCALSPRPCSSCSRSLLQRKPHRLNSKRRVSSPFRWVVRTVVCGAVRARASPVRSSIRPPLPPPSSPPPAGSGLMEAHFDGKVELRGQRVTMRQIIVWLTEKTDRPIIDKTGLTDRYDFTMSWRPGSAAIPGEAAAGVGAGAVFGEVGD